MKMRWRDNPWFFGIVMVAAFVQFPLLWVLAGILGRFGYLTGNMVHRWEIWIGAFVCAITAITVVVVACEIWDSP